MSDLTQHQQTSLAHYHRARTAWESGGWVTHDGTNAVVLTALRKMVLEVEA